ncbi:MAG: hypothetical protein HGA51_09695 [Demequinaceae bacterium]|nr:hypothetical protein [Demequinaceae bacterium]
MNFQFRHQAWGFAVAAVGFLSYWAVIIVRAARDDVPFTQVAWQHPLLWLLGAGGGVYLAIYAASYWGTRGTIRTDERDAEIARRADAAGAGMTALGALAAMIMLALGLDAFWAAHTILVSGFLGTLASVGLATTAYTEGLEA